MIEVISLDLNGVDKAAQDPTPLEVLWVRLPPNIQNAIRYGFLGSIYHSSGKWQYAGLMRSEVTLPVIMGGTPIIKSCVEGVSANYLSTPQLG
jgi:hypothetical protein